MINYLKNPRLFEVGEEVYNLILDRAEKITEIAEQYKYPIYTNGERYTVNGFLYGIHKVRALYHLEEFPLTITAELPRPEIKKDTKVRVRYKHTDEWVNRYATGDFYKSRILCYPDGADSSTTDKAQGAIDWDYYEIVEDRKK